VNKKGREERIKGTTGNKKVDHLGPNERLPEDLCRVLEIIRRTGMDAVPHIRFDEHLSRDLQAVRGWFKRQKRTL
jgi:hypothetical protein